MKNYKITVPLSGAHNSPYIVESSIKQYKRAGVTRIFAGVIFVRSIRI